MADNSFRGQVSLELLITLGVVLAFTLPIVFLLLSVSSVNYEKVAKDQADASARSLADSINTVYAQGDGAKRTVLLNTPASTRNITINENEVLVKITISSGDYEAVSPLFAKVENFQLVNRKSGLFSLYLENSGGEVKVSESE